MSGPGYPHLFITLFGPRNETLFGELNMTGITLPRKDTRSAQSDDVGTAASVSASFVRSGYDSRGAAYYICVVILVYALAIASFVVSLARRRSTRDKYRLAHGQIVDYQQREEEEKQQGGCWKQRCSGSSDLPGMPSSPWSSSSSSSTSSNSGKAHQRPDKFDEAPQIVTATGLTPSMSVQVDPDEVITLVQVLPYNNSGVGSPEGSKTSEADGRARYCEDEVAIIPGQELETGQQQKRFRWSMGPDGNIWILQVDDSVVINSTKINNDKTSSNNDLDCQSQPKTDPVGPNQPYKDTSFVQSCPSSSTAAKGPLSSTGVKIVQQVKADQRRPKNLAFSPVPKGYRPRGRSNSRERKSRLLHSDEQGPNTTFSQEKHPILSTGEKTMNYSLSTARENHWEEYHFLDPAEPFCLPPLVSPHLIQKLIHVTSV